MSLDLSLDALLADVPAPPVPAGLAERIAAAAAATAQEPRAGRARRAAGRRHDRRGRWLRRPLLVGVGALGLALSGAVAATLAGVPIPAKIAAVFSQAFGGEEKAEPKAAPPRRARPPRPAPAPVRAEAPPVKPPATVSIPASRLAIARRIVAERRAAGLPTPVADRIERRIRRWQATTPAQRAILREARRERLRQRIETRQAILRERPAPTVVRPREAAVLPPRRPQPAAAPPTRPVYGPIDERANVVPRHRRQDDSAFRLYPQSRDRVRIGGPAIGRPGVNRPRVPGSVVRRPAPTRPRRR